MMNLGDWTTSDTLYVPLTTYDSNGASVTLTGLAVTDIEIYKDGSVTQRASDAGYALLDTDGIDFDGVTGLHGFSIDLGDNTTAGFYANGSQYWLVVNAVTIDGQTVVVTYYFTIGRYLKPTTAGRTLDIQTTGEADANVTLWGGTVVAESVVGGVPVVDTTYLLGIAQSLTDLKDFADAGYDPATNKVQGVVLVDTLTTYTGNTVQTGDSFARIGVAGVGLTDLGGMSTTMKGQINTEADTAATDYGALKPTTAGRTLDVAVTGEAGVDLGNVTGTLTQANVGWVDASSRIDVGSWLGTAVTTSATSAKPEMDMYSVSDRAASADSLEEVMKGVVNSTAKAGTLSTTKMSTNLTEATNDHYIGRIITWTSGVLVGQSTDITDYVGTNGVLTYTGVTEAPSATDSFVLT